MASSAVIPGTGPLTPSEVAFLCESQLITIIPRQRLDRLNLIGGSIPPFHPPQRAAVPLWLAILLKRQRRCNIIPPTWLTTAYLEAVLKTETENPMFSSELPFRWLETAEMLLDACPDDLSSGDAGGGSQDLRVILRGLREIRQTKAREGLKGLESTYLHMNNIGLLEITELRGFAKGVVDNLRKIGSSREEARRDREEQEEEAGGRYRGSASVEMDEDDDDEL